MERFWTWFKEYGIGNYGDACLGVYKCIGFEEEIWFELVNSMWNNHWSVFQYHAKCIHKDIAKTF